MKVDISVKDSSAAGIHESNDSRRRTCTQDDADRQRQAMADQLFDLAAPAVEGPVVARLVPITPRTSDGADAELQPVELRDNSEVVRIGRGRQLQPPYRIDYVPRLSAIHCLLHIHPITKEVMIEDTSTNGCYLNGHRITKNTPTTMHDGDNIWLTQPRVHETVNEAKDVASKRNRTCDRHALSNEPRVAYRIECIRANEVQERPFTCAACAKLCILPGFTLSCKDKLCHACVQTYNAAGTGKCPVCQAVVSAKDLQKVVQDGTRTWCDKSEKTGGNCDVSNEELKNEANLQDHDTGHIGQKRRASEEINIQMKCRCFEDKHSTNRQPFFKRRQAARNVLKLLETNSFTIPPKEATSNSIKRTQRSDMQGTLIVSHLLCSNCKIAFMQTDFSSTTGHICIICTRMFCPSCATSRAKPQHTTKSQHTSQNFGKVKNYVFQKIPRLLFNGNVVEQYYFRKLIAHMHECPQSMWQLCLKHVQQIVVNMNATKSAKLTKSALVCCSCVQQIFSALCSDYYIHQINKNNTNNKTKRPQCQQGERCRQQFTSLQHAKKYSHMYQHC